MKEVTKHYTDGSITVVWKPDRCIHSTLCWKGLTSVFNPKERPWIKMDGAVPDEIIAQVEKCPSGALSYYRNDDEQADKSITDVDTVVEVTENGPLMVYGNITVRHTDGSEARKHRVTAFCRCGASSNKPFCDGTHVRVGFRDD